MHTHADRHGPDYMYRLAETETCRHRYTDPTDIDTQSLHAETLTTYMYIYTDRQTQKHADTDPTDPTCRQTQT